MTGKSIKTRTELGNGEVIEKEVFESGVILNFKKIGRDGRLLHSDEGPACIWPDGTKIWYQGGDKHRIDGPACEFPDGSVEFYWRGERITDHVIERGIHELDSDGMKLFLPLLGAELFQGR